MANTRATLGAVLGTVAQTATMVTDVVKTGSDAVNMLNKFVESAAQDQKDRQVIHRKTSREQMLREARMDVARSNKEVLDFCKDAEDKMLYEAATQLLSDDIFDS